MEDGKVPEEDLDRSWVRVQTWRAPSYPQGGKTKGFLLF